MAVEVAVVALGPLAHYQFLYIKLAVLVVLAVKQRVHLAVTQVLKEFREAVGAGQTLHQLECKLLQQGQVVADLLVAGAVERTPTQQTLLHQLQQAGLVALEFLLAVRLIQTQLPH